MLELRGEPGIATSTHCAPDYGEPCRSGRLAGIEGLVHREILPRLFQAHSRDVSPPLPLENFARALIDADESAAPQALARLSDGRGDGLLHEALAPAARLLGEWWEQDVCDFFDVSLAMARLQAVLASHAASQSDEAPARSMLLLTPPGETHLFGAEMAADLFRREGWRVQRANGDLSALGEQTFDAVGVSCGCARGAEALPQFIAEIRKLTRRRLTRILLGGALFVDHPERAENLNVNFVASDPNSTRRITRALLQPRRV